MTTTTTIAYGGLLNTCAGCAGQVFQRRGKELPSCMCRHSST